VKVTAGSELAGLLKDADVAPLVLDTDGERYRLARIPKEREGIWAGYDPGKVLEALRKSAGALAGVDRRRLLVDIRAQRSQDTRGRSAS